MLESSAADPHQSEPAGHFDADLDLDPACHFDADMDLDLACHFDADPYPDPTFQFDPDPHINTSLLKPGLRIMIRTDLCRYSLEMLRPEPYLEHRSLN
jgi:hypothetical protein